MIKALALFLFFSLIPLSFAEIESLIENGHPVSPGSPMAQMVPFLSFTTGSYCSATFLSERTLLTAGHCLDDKIASQVSVQILGNGGKWQRRQAVSLKVHPEYSERRGSRGQTIIRNDLAIVQIARPFSFPIRKVKLISPEALSESTWSKVTDIGYGYGSAQGNGKVLRYGEMNAKLSYIDQFDNRIGLYQEKKEANQIVCPGDSGGPVLLGDSSSELQVAVHSMSSGCQLGGSFAYSELVWPAIEWIRSQVR